MYFHFTNVSRSNIKRYEYFVICAKFVPAEILYTLIATAASNLVFSWVFGSANSVTRPDRSIFENGLYTVGKSLWNYMPLRLTTAYFWRWANEQFEWLDMDEDDQAQRCQGIKSDVWRRAFQSSEARAGQIIRHKIFQYLAIIQVWCNKFCSNFQRIAIWYSFSYLLTNPIRKIIKTYVISINMKYLYLLFKFWAPLKTI